MKAKKETRSRKADLVLEGNSIPQAFGDYDGLVLGELVRFDQWVGVHVI
jgi:hypothetical protein